MTVRELIKQVPLFKELTEAETDQIEPLCRVVEGQEGDCMIRERRQVRSIYFLLSGEAAIIKEMDTDIHIPITTVGKGAILGEMSLLENTPASATVEAKGPFTALVIDREEFNRLIDNDHDLGYKIVRKLAQIESARLRSTSGLLVEYMAPH